ncbi:MAG: hypothetical protein U0930_00785 [Pirellulales bacterium]
MSDTRQCVFWALEKSCKLRSGDRWQDPVVTRQQLYLPQQCCEEMSKDNPKVVDGIWVTGEYWGRDSNDETIYIPSSGVKIDEIGNSLGGWKTAVNTCCDCPANVIRSKNLKNRILAGCFGDLEVMFPSSGSLDELLWKIIDRRQMKDRLEDAFQLTEPLWFGFWMESPLNRKQCRVLSELLSNALPLLWNTDPADPGSEPVFGDVQFAFRFLTSTASMAVSSPFLPGLDA